MASDQLLTKKIGEEFTCVGEWWIPDTSDPRKPKFKHCGTLAFSHGEGIKLNVIGWFGETALPENPAGDRSIEMIWGISTEGEIITLVGCQRVGITIGQGSAETYLINAVFVSKNVWFTPSDAIAFKSLTLQYTHLHEWVGISGFQVPTFEKFNELIKAKKAEIIYKRPKQPQPLKVKDYIVSIGFGYSLPGFGPAAQKAMVEQSTSLFVTPEVSTEITLKEVQTLTMDIQNLLSLLTFSRIYPLVIEGAVQIGGEKAEKEQEAVMRLLYESKRAPTSTTKLSQHDMLFTYKDVADVLENAMNKMISTEGEKLKPVFDHFFAEYFSPPAYVEDRFMAVILAIEAFHRRTCKRDYYVEKEGYLDEYFERLCEPVKNVVKDVDLPEDLRQSFQDTLKSKLSYAYQYSLKRRLDELFNTSYGEDFLTFFVINQEEKEKIEKLLEEAGTEEEKEKKRKHWMKEQRTRFIQKVVKTRNWFTHFDEEDGRQAIKGGKDLAYLNLKLELFMMVLLLDYLDIPLQKIEEKLKLYRFDYLRPK